MRREFQETVLAKVPAAEAEQSGLPAAALETSRTADRQRMEARGVVLSRRLRRLRVLRRGIPRLLRRSLLLSLTVTAVGFGGMSLLAVLTSSFRNAAVMAAIQVLVLGLQALVLLPLLGGVAYGLSAGLEHSVRNQARREGLDLNE